MATASKLECQLKIGDSIPPFNLLGIDQKKYSLNSFSNKKILVVIFTCNHCPYVQGWEDRFIEIQKNYESKGVQLIGINSNDTKKYPEDSFEKMVSRAKEKNYNFPYLRDEDQKVAQSFDAACTPEIFIFDDQRRLQYHGRVDDNYQDPKSVKSHDLRDALDDLVANRPVKTPTTPAMGCSIKWSA